MDSNHVIFKCEFKKDPYTNSFIQIRIIFFNFRYPITLVLLSVSLSIPFCWLPYESSICRASSCKMVTSSPTPLPFSIDFCRNPKLFSIHKKIKLLNFSNISYHHFFSSFILFKSFHLFESKDSYKIVYLFSFKIMCIICLGET
jgi:hypothetical protein